MQSNQHITHRRNFWNVTCSKYEKQNLQSKKFHKLWPLICWVLLPLLMLWFYLHTVVISMRVIHGSLNGGPQITEHSSFTHRKCHGTRRCPYFSTHTPRHVYADGKQALCCAVEDVETCSHGNMSYLEIWLRRKDGKYFLWKLSWISYTALSVWNAVIGNKSVTNLLLAVFHKLCKWRLMQELPERDSRYLN